MAVGNDDDDDDDDDDSRVKPMYLLSLVCGSSLSLAR